LGDFGKRTFLDLPSRVSHWANVKGTWKGVPGRKAFEGSQWTSVTVLIRICIERHDLALLLTSAHLRTEGRAGML